MKPKNIKLIIMILLFVMTLSVTAQQTHTLEQFDEIKVVDRINVELIKSSDNKAVISGADANDVKIENKSGKLKVYMELTDFLEGKDTQVDIYYTDELELVEAKQGANITADNAIKTKYLVINSQQGSEVKLEVDAENVEAKAVSGGNITIDGNASELEVTVRSGGDYYGKELESENTDVSVFAGGGAEVYAVDYVDASVTAGGTIKIYGNPDRIERDETFGGTISQM